MATKAELLAEISSFYAVVGVPFETTSSDEHVPNEINTYSVIVYETGLSEKSKRPVLRSKYINFIVHNEYLPGEAAYYADDELTNDVDKDVTSDNSLASIHALYNSEVIRGRVQAAIAKAARAVLLENKPRATMLEDTASGQKHMRVNTPMLFWQGKVVLIRESASVREVATIKDIDIDTGYLTFENNLTNSYTTAGNTRVIFEDNVERKQWAVNALLSPDAYTLSMTSLVSLDTTVQAAGGLVTDTVIEGVVTSYISTVAAASYL